MLKTICLSCQSSINRRIPLCENCENSLIISCEMREKYFKEGQKLIKLNYFWSFNGTARKLIMQGKYKYNRKCFELLSEIIYANNVHKFDFGQYKVCYVPTTYLRYCFRGFNQSKVISAGLGFKSDKILKRIRYTKSQVKSDVSARFNRLEQFKCINQNLGQKKVLIIDDVCTTGSTLLECAKTIQTSNQHCEVEFLTLAYRKSYRIHE